MPECFQSSHPCAAGGHLLILGCSKKKCKVPGRVPALEIYDGGNFQVLRKYFREKGWPPGLMVKIISAKHGMIDATTLIETYDQRLDKEAAKKLKPKVLHILKELELPPESVFINLGKNYLPAIDGIDTLFSSDNISYARGRIGEKMRAMKKWLHDLPNCTASISGYPSDERSYLYFFPDWDDYVYEPFHANETPEVRRKENRKYAHEIFGKKTPYDGLLLSLAQLRKGSGLLKRLVNQESPDLREELRLPGEMLLFGDCGAFSYTADDEPPISPEGAAEHYHKFGFDLGASVDHIPLPSQHRCDQKKRMALTKENAETFLAHCKNKGYEFKPIGSIQGLDPKDYARFVREYVEMGYQHIALGGLVRRKDSEILEIVAAVREALQVQTRGKPENVWIHLFGVLRPKLQPSFQILGVSSFDSASYFRRAWMSSDKNYLTADAKTLEEKWYGTIRIPFSSSKAMRAAAELHLKSAEELQALEKKCLSSLEDFGSSNRVSIQEVLDNVNEYSPLLQRRSGDNHFEDKHEALLTDRPWAKCPCQVCKDASVEIVVFRGANRNRRRGFHNTWVFYHKILHGKRSKSSKKSGK